jgi:hypothetical protein
VKQFAPRSKDIGKIIERDLADILFVGFFHAEQKTGDSIFLNLLSAVYSGSTPLDIASLLCLANS